jgi:uncharacterized protein YukE
VIKSLHEYSLELAECSNHVALSMIAVALCLLPDPPPWAVENRDFVRNLGKDGARLVADYERKRENLVSCLEAEAASERTELGEPTWEGPASAEHVAEQAERADALLALAKAVKALGGGGEST